MSNDKITERELHALFRKRQMDQKRATTKRRKQLFHQPSDCGSILEGLFKKDEATLQKIEETKALLAWERYVGPATHLHAKAERIRRDPRSADGTRMANGTIIVRVTDPLWMNELSLLKNSLLDRFRKEFPRLRITDLFFTR